MIKKDFYKQRKDGVNLYRTYSDENFRIKQVETGDIFDEAIDIEDAVYTYEETTEKIEQEELNEITAEQLWEEVVLDGLK